MGVYKPGILDGGAYNSDFDANVFVRLRDNAAVVFFRAAASIMPLRHLWAQSLPPRNGGPPSDGAHDLEIVSHCWRYEHLLTYQLSSLVLYPPEASMVQMTVFYCDDDRGTKCVLEFFRGQRVPNVAWQFCPLPRSLLFRRSIGRNLAARATRANWIWFTDCDVTFQAGALDELVTELRTCDALLAFPGEHQVSDILESSDSPRREGGVSALQPIVRDIDRSRFRPERRRKATGGFQIVPADVARSIGYCSHLRVFQRPTVHFGATWEDRTFRWLLGTHGTPLRSSEFYRIRHAAKGRHGRYTSHSSVMGMAPNLS